MLKKIHTVLSVIFTYLLAASSITHSAEVQFYTVGHADDWQLFMNPEAYNNTIIKSNKSVFIHTTAGDAGNANNSTGGKPIAYYKAREEGALRAIRFMVNANNGSGGPNATMTIQTFMGHTLERFSYGNTVAYFLRLPDGNQNGSGYPGTNHESLQRLYNSNINEINAVDASAVYNDWDDLVGTLASIVQFESTGRDNITFNIADTDTNNNPGDHSDHRYTSLAMQDVAANNACITLRLYEEYVTDSKIPNVTGNDLIAEAGTWAATTSGLSDHFYNSTWESSHNAWIGKSYSRTVEGTGCQNADPNHALSATASASSENPNTLQQASKAIDGVIDGYPGDHTKEWVTQGEGIGAYLRLQWNSNIEINTIILHDRPNLSDHITSAKLVFGDASEVAVPQLNNDGTATIIQLPISKATDSVELKIEGVSSSTVNIGLAEIRVQ